MNIKIQRYSLVDVTPADGSEPYSDLRERELGGVCMFEDVEQLAADLATSHKLLREVRMYALGSDCSTMALIKRVDEFLGKEPAQP